MTLAVFRRRALSGPLAIAAACLLQVQAVRAHTVSVGYENAGPGAVTFWYGTYHASNFTEGSMQLVGPSVNTTVAFTLVTASKPAGLIDGTTNFFSNGSVLVGNYAQSTTPTLPIIAWQGVTFSGLSAGNYTFTYVPIANPTADWDPIDAVILSSTVNLSASVLSGGALLPLATNTNQNSVANAIDTAIANGATNPGFANLANLSPAALQNALTQLSGEAATGVQQAGLQMMNPFLVMLLDPFIATRNGSFGPATAFAPERPLPPQIAAAYDAVTFNAQRPDTVERRWNIWSSAYGGQNRTDGDGTGIGSHDSRVRAAGGAAGFDYRFTPDTVAGFAMSGGSASWSLTDGLGGGESDVFQAGVYASTRLGAAYLSGAFAYAWHRMETDRFLFVAGTDHLAARFDAHSLGGRIEGGYRVASHDIAPGAEVIPYAALQMQALRTPNYAEYALSGSNTFALSYGANTRDSIRSEAGLWIGNRFALDRGATLMLRGRAAWVHDWQSDDAAQAVFQTLPGASFVVQGAQAAPNALLASLTAELAMASGLLLSAKLDGEFSRTSETYVATASARYTW